MEARFNTAGNSPAKKKKKAHRQLHKGRDDDTQTAVLLVRTPVRRINAAAFGSKQRGC